MPFTKKTAASAVGKTAPCAFGVKARKLFLDELAVTANVSAASRAAGVHSGIVYRERLKSAEFRAQWMAALAEGYVRLETSLLADALVAASAKASDKTLKARADKAKLRLSLLSHHKTSVRGGVPALTRKRVELPGTSKERVVAKLREMRRRMKDSDGLC